MDLILIRHAEPIRVGEGEVEGPADPPLHERGRAQAERLGDWLADEAVDALYASPLRRARQTAEVVAAAVGQPVRFEDRLAEFDRHAGHYIPVEELRATKDPRLASWGRGDFSDVDADPVEFQARAVAGVEAIIGANPRRRVAVVCHGGVINAYVARICQVPRILFFDVGYTGISRVAASRGGLRTVQSLNELAHLRGTGLLPD